jgi:hypothetical protein
MVAEGSLEEMLIILACLAGILLGLTFNVVVLVPFVLAGGIAYAVMSVGQSPGATAIAILISAFSLQAGYMIGLTGRDMFAQILTRLNIAQSKRI